MIIQGGRDGGEDMKKLARSGKDRLETPLGSQNISWRIASRRVERGGGGGRREEGIPFLVKQKKNKTKKTLKVITNV